MGRIDTRRDGATLTLTLANPGRANALDGAMLAQLDAQVAAVEADADIRLLVLRGSAGGVFSSGADIAEWGPMSPAQFGREWIAHGNAVFRRFEALRCPTVAAIEGVCFGGGLELALCADLRVASDAARFRFPEVGIGAIPGWEGGERLARIAGRGRALEAVLTARTLDAATADRWGLANAVWPAAEFDARLAEWIAVLTGVSPAAAAIAKQAIVGSHDPETFYPDAGECIKASADAAEGLAAFRAKRAPQF